MTDIILGLKDIEYYTRDPAYMGAVVGRVANRIANGRFVLNGVEYCLKTNAGKNHIHGGECGFDKKIFDVEIIENGLRFTYLSKDMEEGYPGNLKLMVQYTVDHGDFEIRYEAISDADTIVNFTNHAYFNLSDDLSPITNHYLRIRANRIGCINTEGMANGEQMMVSGTPFDFNERKMIGRDIRQDDIQLKLAKGYDHPFILEGTENQICLEDEVSGRRLVITTTAPVCQVYTGNYLGGGPIGKHGKNYSDMDGVALETQFMPNAINTEENPSVILRKDEKFESITKYAFSVF